MGTSAYALDDWLFATLEDRRILYRVSKRILDATGMKWDALYAAAFGKPVSVGSGFEDNFRHGKIDRTKAMRIHEWIVRNHPDHAEEIQSLRNSYREQSGWREILADRGLIGDGVDSLIHILEINYRGSSVHRESARAHSVDRLTQSPPRSSAEINPSIHRKKCGE